jgi:hypothetical protein
MPGGVGGAVSDGRPYPDLLLVLNITCLLAVVLILLLCI